MNEKWDSINEESVFTPATAVESFTVSVTVSKKHLGDLISITVGETRKAEELLSAGEAAVIRREAAEALLVQANAICKEEIESRGTVIAAPVNAGFTQTATTTAVPGGTMTMSAPVVGTNAAAVQAVANGAPVGNDGWMSVPSKFGGEDLRFKTTAAYSSQQLEADVNAWLMNNGLNPQFFKCWDNRPGARGLEAGNPQGCVANIKLVDGAPGSEQLGKAAAARVKFNSNGTLYIWKTKEFDAALKFVGQMLAMGGAPVNNPFN